MVRRGSVGGHVTGYGCPLAARSDKDADAVLGCSAKMPASTDKPVGEAEERAHLPLSNGRLDESASRKQHQQGCPPIAGRRNRCGHGPGHGRLEATPGRSPHFIPHDDKTPEK